MGDGSVGRTESIIRSTAAVERTGSATDRQRRHPQQDDPRQGRPDQERRDREPPNPRRRRLYDLLFDEIDQIVALDEGQKTRIKQNIRQQLNGGHAPPPTGPPPVPEPPAPPPAAPPLDEEAILQLVAPTHPHLPPQELAENALLATRLRECVALRTTTARRVGVYLRRLLALKGPRRPQIIVDT